MNSSNKKNLIFVITKSEVGGAQKWVSEQKIILESHFNIFLITSDKGWLTEQFDAEKLFIVPGLKSVRNIFNIFSIAKILKKTHADIVVSNSANAGLYARLSKLLWKHRSIYVSHGWSCIYNGGHAQKIYCLIERLLSYISDSILCVSENDKKNAISIIGINRQKLTTINNATLPAESIFDAGYNNSGPLRLVFVGRMTHPKRPDLLADAVSAIDNVEVYFIGGGEYLEALKKKHSNNIKVNFLGEVKGFCNYKDFDAFILVSESEGLPMSAVEAGVVGLPLLLSDVGGCGELIYEYGGGKNGLLLRNNVEEISMAIEEMKINYKKYKYVAKEIAHHFDLNHLKDDYIALYKG